MGWPSVPWKPCEVTEERRGLLYCELNSWLFFPELDVFTGKVIAE